MKSTKQKKIAAALAAVQLYLDQESRVEATGPPVPGAAFSPWKFAGRLDAIAARAMNIHPWRR